MELDFSREPEEPRTLDEVIMFAMCIGPLRDFLPSALQLIVQHHRRIVEQHLREAKTEEVRSAIMNLFTDLTKEKTK